MQSLTLKVSKNLRKRYQNFMKLDWETRGSATSALIQEYYPSVISQNLILFLKIWLNLNASLVEGRQNSCKMLLVTSSCISGERCEKSTSYLFLPEFNVHPIELSSLSTPLKMYQLADFTLIEQLPMLLSGLVHSRPAWQYFVLKLSKGLSKLTYRLSYFLNGERYPILAVKFPQPFLSKDWLMLPQNGFFFCECMQRQGIKFSLSLIAYLCFCTIFLFKMCSFSRIRSQSSSLDSIIPFKNNFCSQSSSFKISSLFSQCSSRQLSYFLLLAPK